MARVLERAGLEPAGTHGFLQEVPLERVLPEGPLVLVLELEDGERLEGKLGLDFDLDRASAARGPLVPRLVRASADVGEPDPSVALLVDGSLRDLRAWLEAAGAPEGRGFGLILRAGSPQARGAASERAARERLVPRRDRQASPEIGRVHGELLAALRGGLVRALSLEGGARREPASAWNVVGILRGAGSPEAPDAAERAMVLSAHFDHLGLVRDPAPGADRVYNGADDNASGSAAVLEIAEALALGPRPAHSLVVLLATGEERGLFGTEHYLAEPAWPLERTLFDLNLEMIGRPDELVGGAGKLWLVGWDLTDLGPALAERGLPVVADPRPEQDFFRRSDNYAFVLRGVLGQTLSSYGMHADYHTPQDEVERIDFEHLTSAARSVLEVARAILEGELVPAWRPGVEQGSRRR